jgi:hypothetical protein
MNTTDRFQSKVWYMSRESINIDTITNQDANELWEEILWLIRFIRRRLKKYNLTYTLNENSLELANWMLAFSSLEELDHALFLIKFGRSSGSAQLFRDVIATNDLIRLINLKGQEKYLQEWFGGAWSNHRDYRAILEKKNIDEATERKNLYEGLSNMPHITYKSIKSQFVFSENLRFWHGSSFRTQYSHERNLVTPREWIWTLASLCKDYVFCVHDERIITDKNFCELYNSLKKTSPKAFIV